MYNDMVTVNLALENLALENGMKTKMGSRIYLHCFFQLRRQIGEGDKR